MKRPRGLGRREALRLAVAALGASVTGSASGADARGSGVANTSPQAARGDAPTVSALRGADLDLGTRRGRRRRVRLLVPRDAPAGARWPAVVLLHGRGETRSEALGLSAWPELYGLEAADAALRTPPVPAPAAGPRYLTEARRAALNDSLAARPFAGLVYLCPAIEDPARARSREAALEAEAEFLVDELLPALPGLAPVAGPVGIAGCSLGGPIGFEVFARRPGAFAALGGLQAAVGTERAPHHAAGIASAAASGACRGVRLVTSTGDPYRAANAALAGALRGRGVAADLDVLPGPHDQPFLREAGTLHLLWWLERTLAGAGPG